MNQITKSIFQLCLLILTISTTALAQEYSRLIPSKSFMVMDFNLNRVSGKLNFKTVENFYWAGKLDAIAEKQFDEFYPEVSKIYKNPSAAGIDTTGHLYWFFYMDTAAKSPEPCMILPLKDRAKFEKVFNSINKDKLVSKIKEYKNIKYHARYSDLVFWTDKYFVYMDLPYTAINTYDYYDYNDYYTDTTSAEVDTEDLEERNKEYETMIQEKIDNFLSLSSNESVAADADFKNFKSKNFDMGFWMNLEVLGDTSLHKDELTDPSFYSFLQTSTKDLHLHYYINFETGEISFDGNNTYNKQAFDLYKKIYSNKFNPKLLDYIKRDSLLSYATMSVNLVELHNSIPGTKDNEVMKSFIGQYGLSNIFASEIAAYPEMKELQAKIDSLNEITYGNYNYDYDNYSDEYGADTTAVTPYYEEAPVEEDTKGKKKDKKKKEKKDKSKKKKNEETEYDYTYPADTAYSEDYNYNYDAYTQLYELEKTRDSLKSVLAFRYLNENGISEQDLWTFFKGDMAGAITKLYEKEVEYVGYDYDEDMNSIEVKKTKKELVPEFIIAATVGNAEKLQKFIDLIEKKGFLTKENSIYKIPASFNSATNYVFVRDGIFFVTNRHHLAVTQPKGYGTASLGADPAALKTITGSPVVLYGDVAKISNIIVKNSTMPRIAREIAKGVGSSISKTTVSGTYPSDNRMSSSFKVTMKNSNENSVIGISRMIDSIFLAVLLYSW